MPMINNQEWDMEGNLIFDEWVDVPWPTLDRIGVAATLNAVLELWTVEDAAQAAGVSPEHLIAEAEAWAAASGDNNVS